MWILCWICSYRKKTEAKRRRNGDFVLRVSEWWTDATSTALQWIMANLVKHPHIQAKLFQEINGVIGEGKEKVILEGLRRHPAYFVAYHSVTQDLTFKGYVIPKKGSINFMISHMNCNPKIWEDPMEFKPERFFNSKGNNGDDQEVFDFDITGSREIKMMTFGAGRRICPGYGLATRLKISVSTYILVDIFT